jgi:hypothetical protein
MSICAYAQRNKKNVFWGKKRDPSERHTNSNLRNLTHITQKPSYVYTFFTSTLKEITVLDEFTDTHYKMTRSLFENS